MVQSLPLHASEHIDSTIIESISMVGNLGARRWRWNPFINDQDFMPVGDSFWERSVFLEGPKGTEHTGNFSCRLVLNHNSKRHLKCLSVDAASLTWLLAEDEDGKIMPILILRCLMDAEVLFRFNSETLQLQLIPMGIVPDMKAILQPVVDFKGYELNGFVWDDLSMFDKFQCRRPGRSFQPVSPGLWSLDVPLKANGGIDFRADGVYQFLISADGEEDFGFSALNDGTGRLVRGTGFGSSHGSSVHSGCTIKVKEDGI
jgi:hypothetical protein